MTNSLTLSGAEQWAGSFQPQNTDQVLSPSRVRPAAVGTLAGSGYPASLAALSALATLGCG